MIMLDVNDRPRDFDSPADMPLRWTLPDVCCIGRTRMEEQLRQAEKMNAIGRFATGIAHDFNNVLGAIVGYAEMLVDEAPEGTNRKRHAHSVRTAAMRGRGLVDPILAYVRSDPASRTPTDVCRTVLETLDLVSSSLPAAITMLATIPQSADRDWGCHPAASGGDESLQQCHPRDEGWRHFAHSGDAPRASRRRYSAVRRTRRRAMPNVCEVRERSAWSPVRIAGEQSVDEADLVNQKEAEAEAQKAGREFQRAIEPGQPARRVCERETDRCRDQHHPGDRPNAEDP
jgi:hypothetical protein